MYDYSYWDDQAVASAILGIFAVVWIVIVLISVFITVCQWRIFTKAGQPGWKALIPFYSGWVFNQIIFGPQFGWLMFASLIAFIPFVGSLAMIAWTVYTYVKLANAYGKSGGFGAFTVFFPVIGLPILAFGSSQYCGPQAPFFAKNQQVGGWNQSGTGTGAWGQQNQWGQQPQQNAWGQQPQQNAWGQQPQANQWGQAPAQQPQQNAWGQTPAQQPQQDAWGQAPVQQPQSGWTGQAPAQNPWANTQNADPNQQDNSNPFV